MSDCLQKQTALKAYTNISTTLPVIYSRYTSFCILFVILAKAD